MNAPDVVIIGAGFAGLSAAVRLAGAGARVLVAEARPRLGGRATSFDDRATGLPVDNGQHVLFGCYHETLAFLDTIGALDRVRIQPSLNVPYVDVRGRPSRLQCPDLPAPLHLFAGLIGWDALRWRDRVAAIRVWRAVRAAAGVDGRRSVSEWLSQLRQPRRLRTFLWEPLAVAALNEPPEAASAGAFAAVLSLMFHGDPRNAAMVLPAVPLDQMYGEPARAFLEARGGTVRLNALARIAAGAQGVSGVRIGEETIPCRRVISTVPWNTFAGLFGEGGIPPALRETAAGAARIVSRPIVTANLWYDRPVMNEPFVGFPGATIQWVFEKETHSPHLSCIVSGAIELVDRSNQEIVAVARRDVEDRLPRARRATFLRGTAVRERHATFSTNQHDVPRPQTVTPLPGFYLAGDWTDTGLPGTIEGAVRSGHAAAQALSS